MLGGQRPALGRCSLQVLGQRIAVLALHRDGRLSGTAVSIRHALMQVGLGGEIRSLLIEGLGNGLVVGRGARGADLGWGQWRRGGRRGDTGQADGKYQGAQ